MLYLIHYTMANKINDQLFQLVKTLTKAEKRHFQLGLSSNPVPEQPLFRQLFRILDRMEHYDESLLLARTPAIKKRQLSNLKRHLYRQVLSSLRQLYRNRDPHIQYREYLDYARVLYDKGLYRQSLRFLDKLKQSSRQDQAWFLLQEALEFEKLIESRHITRSLEDRADSLRDEAVMVREQIARMSYLSDLSLQLYGRYLKTGHARNQEDYQSLKEFFEPRISGILPASLGFHEKTYLFQSYCWYYYILQDFSRYYRYARKWVDLFGAFPSFRLTDPSGYLKGLHNLLTADFYNARALRFHEDLVQMESFIRDQEIKFDDNTETMAFVYVYTARINRHFLEGTFQEGLSLVEPINQRLTKYQGKIDPHRIMIFHYKIACLYFGSGNSEEALYYLNQIIRLRVGNLRSDIQCFARILHLIAHYELEQDRLVESLIPSVYRFISRHRDLGLVMDEILHFLRRNLYTNLRDLGPAFRELKDRLEVLSGNPFEKRSFLYLDIISWLESKILGEPVGAIIRRKFLNHIPRF